jgi:alginate O-acetyltransferase complex protein AlgI
LYRGLPLIIATVFFAIQIYCDFSGYSDIARGAAHVMGLRLSENFHQPYAATSIADFWRRWHISLSTWFRDYVYIPLGGNRSSRPRWAANIMITFTLSGLWHGASWTFVLWGAVHGVYFIAGRATARVREAVADAIGLSRLPIVHRLLKIVVTFALVCSTWVLFRARTAADAWYVVSHAFPLLPPSAGPGLMVRLGLANLPLAKHEWLIAIALVAGTVAAQVLRWRDQLRDGLQVWPAWTRWSIYYAAGAAIMFLGVFVRSAFIYFQF